jgi:hypothetical protein
VKHYARVTKRDLIKTLVFVKDLISNSQLKLSAHMNDNQRPWVHFVARIKIPRKVQTLNTMIFTFELTGNRWKRVSGEDKIKFYKFYMDSTKNSESLRVGQNEVERRYLSQP